MTAEYVVVHKTAGYKSVGDEQTISYDIWHVVVDEQALKHSGRTCRSEG